MICLDPGIQDYVEILPFIKFVVDMSEQRCCSMSTV